MWYFKKTGKELHPWLKEAIDNFEHGKTLQEREKKKLEKSLALYVEN